MGADSGSGLDLGGGSCWEDTGTVTGMRGIVIVGKYWMILLGVGSKGLGLKNGLGMNGLFVGGGGSWLGMATDGGFE